jgi:hypothetical protein
LLRWAQLPGVGEWLPDILHSLLEHGTHGCT